MAIKMYLKDQMFYQHGSKQRYKFFNVVLNKQAILNIPIKKIFCFCFFVFFSINNYYGNFVHVC